MHPNTFNLVGSKSGGLDQKKAFGHGRARFDNSLSYVGSAASYTDIRELRAIAKASTSDAVAVAAATVGVDASTAQGLAGQRRGWGIAERSHVSRQVRHVFVRQKPASRHVRRNAIR